MMGGTPPTSATETVIAWLSKDSPTPIWRIKVLNTLARVLFSNT